MPTRLKNLKIKRVALVDEGANPDAFVRFAKSKGNAEAPDGDGEEEMTADEAQSIVKRFFTALHTMWSGLEENIRKKDGKTFAELSTKQDYSEIMEREVWPMIYAMSDSARSILLDDDRDEGAKEALLVQSAKEFADAFAQAASNWAKGQATGNIAKSSNEDMIRLRDELNTCIAKNIAEAEGAIDVEPQPPEEPDTATPAPAASAGQEQPEETAQDDEQGIAAADAQKGETDMIFDTDKMTPEDKAQFEELAKRYGHEEAAAVEQPDAATPVTEPDDVYKGLHPAVKEELETLRKFREEAEERQYLEIAKGYAILGKQPEQLAATLKSLKAAGGTAYDDMIAMLDSTKAQLENSGLFSEIGKRGTSNSAEDSWAKIEAAAQEIAKARPNLTMAQAIDEACIQHPDLVDAYEKSRR